MEAESRKCMLVGQESRLLTGNVLATEQVDEAIQERKPVAISEPENSHSKRQKIVEYKVMRKISEC